MTASRLICATALAMLSACQASAPRPVAEAEVDAGMTVELPDVGGPASSTEEVRVTVNSSIVTSPPAEEGGDRVVISAMRNALRTGSLDSYLRALSNASCQGRTVAQAETIPVTAASIALQASDPRQRRVGELTFVAGFQLTSTDKRFGGLSGIEMLDNGNLLAVSDEGWFVWLDLDREGLQPVAARIAPLRETTGEQVDLARGAAEGIALNGGIALVSFEGEHRVLAYDVGKCGATARGAPIVFDNYGLDLKDAYADARVDVSDSEGSEALAVTSDWYMFAGIEQKVDNLSLMSARPIEAEPDFALRVGVNAPEFAGLDILPAPRGDGRVRAFLLHRSVNPDDPGIAITETAMLRFVDTNIAGGPGEMGARARYRFSETGWRELGKLNQFGAVDSFEGVAARELGDGRVRLYIISDDDFSPDGRTVLMIFDLAKPMR